MFFYAWWNIIYLPLILFSIITNYIIAKKLQSKKHNKPILLIGLLFNIGLLAYYKYMDFFIANINYIWSENIGLYHLALPLAISFYTLQQIAYLVDSYGGLVKKESFFDYTLFVVFFPQLIAGPIVHHKEMMPQFFALKNKMLNYQNISMGLFLFSIGLFKKVMIADHFAKWASTGFSNTEQLNLIEAWLTSLSYTFQLYFDFSGYTDMAIGIALLFNIKLPENFNSPYKSTSIIEFWSRWHMTLTRFLTTYIYTPIVKSFHKFSFAKAMFATFITMLIAGLWHGAAWTFVLFGVLHGIALIINHYFRSFKIKLNVVLAWFLTFNFLNFTFIIFRADTLRDAWNVMKAMFTGDLVLSYKWQEYLSWLDGKVNFGVWLLHINSSWHILLYVVGAFIITIKFKNSQNITSDFQPNLLYLTYGLVLFTSAILSIHKVSEFLYFNF